MSAIVVVYITVNMITRLAIAC